MKITTDYLEDRQARITIEIDEEQTERAMRRAARQISRQVEFPGFRPGKAPYDRVVQRFGESVIREEAAELLIEPSFEEALQEEELTPYAPATLEEVFTDPVSFTFLVPLIPEVDVGDYRDYRLKPPKVKADKQAIKERLEQIRRDNAILELVERPVEMGDGVAFDVVGEIEGRGTVLDQEDVHIILEPESEALIPGLDEELIDMEAEEERTFTLPLPEDFDEETEADQITLTVTVREVYDASLPDLDDDLARTVGNYDSIKDLKEDVKEEIRQQAQRRADEEYAQNVVEAIVDQASVEYPPAMVEETVDDMMDGVRSNIKQKTGLAFEDYLRIKETSEEEIREDLIPQAETQLKQSLVLGKIAGLESLELSKGEITAEIEAISQEWGDLAEQMRKALSTEESRGKIASRLMGDKVMQRLVAIAKGEASELDETDEANDEDEDGA